MINNAHKNQYNLKMRIKIFNFLMKDNLNLLVKDSNINKNYKIAYKKAKVLEDRKD
jgi:hypothetical protein